MTLTVLPWPHARRRRAHPASWQGRPFGRVAVERLFIPKSPCSPQPWHFSRRSAATCCDRAVRPRPAAMAVTLDLIAHGVVDLLAVRERAPPDGVAFAATMLATGTTWARSEPDARPRRLDRVASAAYAMTTCSTCSRPSPSPPPDLGHLRHLRAACAALPSRRPRCARRGRRSRTKRAPLIVALAVCVAPRGNTGVSSRVDVLKCGVLPWNEHPANTRRLLAPWLYCWAGWGFR